MICCRNVKISALIAARDRNRSPTAHTVSLIRSLITDQHRPILGQPPANRFATGTGAALVERLSVEYWRWRRGVYGATASGPGIANPELVEKGELPAEFLCGLHATKLPSDVVLGCHVKVKNEMLELRLMEK